MFVNSLWPFVCDAIIWRHTSGSTLAQVMTCWLIAISHYLNLCPMKFIWGQFLKDTSLINHKNNLILLEIFIHISQRGQWCNNRSVVRFYTISETIFDKDICWKMCDSRSPTVQVIPWKLYVILWAVLDLLMAYHRKVHNRTFACTVVTSSNLTCSRQARWTPLFVILATLVTSVIAYMVLLTLINARCVTLKALMNMMNTLILYYSTCALNLC